MGGMENREAIRAIIRERRRVLNRFQATEAKLSGLQSRLNLLEVKLACFGVDLEKLRSQRMPERLFKGFKIQRRIADLLRSAAQPIRADEIARVLALEDGLDPARPFVRIAGRSRVKEALKRARRKQRSARFSSSGCDGKTTTLRLLAARDSDVDVTTK